MEQVLIAVGFLFMGIAAGKLADILPVTWDFAHAVFDLIFFASCVTAVVIVVDTFVQAVSAML